MQEVNVGIWGEMENLQPFIAFVYHKEFQIAQLLSIHNQEKKEGGAGSGEDQEQIALPSKLHRQQLQLEMFWNMPIDFDDDDSSSQVVKDIAPFIVLEDTPMNKLHFLFIMLNISQVNIVNQGIITGIITKLEFLKKRKEEKEIMKQERKRRQFISYITVGGLNALNGITHAIGLSGGHGAQAQSTRPQATSAQPE